MLRRGLLCCKSRATPRLGLLPPTVLMPLPTHPAPVCVTQLAFSKYLASTMLASQTVVPRLCELGSCASLKVSLQAVHRSAQNHRLNFLEITAVAGRRLGLGSAAGEGGGAEQVAVLRGGCAPPAVASPEHLLLHHCSGNRAGKGQGGASC